MSTSIESMVSYYTNRDLTGEEIMKITGKQPILYSNLVNYTFNSFFPKGAGDYQILILQTKAVNIGHYVLVFLTENNINYFDSYGLGAPDTYKNYTPYDEELPDYLSQLLARDPKRRPIISNYTDYQKVGKSAVCGRYATLRAKLRNLNNSEFESIFIGNKSPFLNRPDYVVCILTLWALDDIREFFDTHEPPQVRLLANISGGKPFSKPKLRKK
jgi:hypothetical protein